MNKKTTTKNNNSRTKKAADKKKAAAETKKPTRRRTTAKSTRKRVTKKEPVVKAKVEVTEKATTQNPKRRSRKVVTKKLVQNRTKRAATNVEKPAAKNVKRNAQSKRAVNNVEQVESKTIAKPKNNSNNTSNNKSTNTSKNPNSSSIQKTVAPEQLVTINQNVAILIDGNNIEKSIHSLVNRTSAMLDFDRMIPKLLRMRGLNRLIYFREGLHISSKLADRLHKKYFGTVVPCHKSADIPLSITATQLADKVDTIIILSGDSDYVDLVRHLRSRGVRVEIAAIKQTTAKILIDEADFFTEITREDCYIL